MSQSKPEYYEVLGLKPGADAAAIKRAYLMLSMKLHPDKQVNKSDAEKALAAKKFPIIVEANNVLSDPKKKDIYDREGHKGLERLASGASSASPGYEDLIGTTAPRKPVTEEDIFDFFGKGEGSSTIRSDAAPSVDRSAAAEERRRRREAGRPSRPAEKETDSTPQADRFSDVAQKVSSAADKLQRAGTAAVPVEALEKFRENLQDFIAVVDAAIVDARKNNPPRP